MFLTVAAVLPYVSPLLVGGVSNNGDKLDLTSLTRACVEVTDAPPPKDGIPAIDNPQYISALEFESKHTTDYLDEARVLGVVINDQAYAYPLDILNWHEIVNDKSDDTIFSVTYCPLTGSGVLFLTNVLNGSTIGTTGTLLENNLVFYDRLSDTWWSQMLGIGICGANAGMSLPTYPMVELLWRDWNSMYPDTQVLSRNTGYSRNYDSNPYAGYEESGSIWFQTSFTRHIYPYNLFHPKEVTYVVTIGSQVYLFPRSELEKQSVINLEYEGENVVILFDKEHNILMSFSATLNGKTLHFSENTDVIAEKRMTFGLLTFTDDSGTVWNLRGEAIAGKFNGESLTRWNAAYNAYWFAAVVHFPSAKIFVNGTYIENILGSTQNKDAVDKNAQIQAVGNVLLFLFALSGMGILIVIPIYSYLKNKRL